eukprot:1818381-Prymnesium_polylepis.2
MTTNALHRQTRRAAFLDLVSEAATSSYRRWTRPGSTVRCVGHLHAVIDFDSAPLHHSQDGVYTAVAGWRRKASRARRGHGPCRKPHAFVVGWKRGTLGPPPTIAAGVHL